MNSKEIVRDIVNRIFAGSLKPNDKILSEGQLSIKHNVSRIVATRAYENLKKIGAIYSKPKKGFFIAENFSGIVRSINDEFKIEKTEDEIIKLTNPEINGNKINGMFFTYKTHHYHENEIIIKSQNWLNTEYQNYTKNTDLISTMIWENKIISATIFLKFEKFNAFKNNDNLVRTAFYYSAEGIIFIQKAVIKNHHFKLTKIEWSI